MLNARDALMHSRDPETLLTVRREMTVTLGAIVAVAGIVVGLAVAGSAGAAVFVVHDLLYNDYLTPGSNACWSADVSESRRFTRQAAERFVYLFRVNEEGEYGDTGYSDYPVVVERVVDRGRKARRGTGDADKHR